MSATGRAGAEQPQRPSGELPWPDRADGVFRGGGVKGAALAGAIKGMYDHPRKPVRAWQNLAGASAGAILAGYLAVGGDPRAIVDQVERIPYHELQDFPAHSRVLGALNLLWGRHGLARGDGFERWFDQVVGGATFAGLHNPEKPERYRLQLIACDVANRKLLVLPDDLRHYAPGRSAPALDPDAVRVSRAARMSMSIPFFYEPVTDLWYVPDKGARRQATIVDGGTLSNFPVWLFDVDENDHPPRWPTFGITLSGGRGGGGGIRNVLLHYATWPVGMAVQIFDTAQSAWDDRFVSHSTRVRTFAVDADGVGTTDFDLDPKQPPLSDIITHGYSKAQAFLDDFDLASYMNTYGRRIQPHAEAPLAPEPPAG